MTAVIMERVLPAPVETVFAFITKPENLVKWWGPEGMTCPDKDLDFSEVGRRWYSVMMNAQGQRFKVSGEVKEVKAPNLVAFTWGWHDDNDARGHESHVSLEVADAGDGKTRLTMTHEDLPDAESRENHSMGWTSTFVKLERAFA